MIEKSRTTGSGARVLDVLIALNGHVINGLTNGQLAKGLSESPSTINRCLNTLIEKSLVTKLPDGSFAQSIKTAQIGIACLEELDRTQARLTEIKQRVLTAVR